MSTDEKVALMIVEDDPFVGGWLGNHCEHLFDDIRNFGYLHSEVGSQI